jgi:opacity protein-like surface antigen
MKSGRRFPNCIGLKKIKQAYPTFVFITIFYIIVMTAFDTKANDTTSFVMADRIGVFFSGDYCNTIQENNLFPEKTTGNFGYKIDLNYLKALKESISLGMGLSFSELQYNYNSTFFGYWDNTSLTENAKIKLSFLEIPVYFQWRFGNSKATNFSLKFGPSLTALIKTSSHISATETDIDGAITYSEFSNQHSYSLFAGKNRATINLSFTLGGGVETRISKNVSLNFYALGRYYRRNINGLFAAGIQVGMNYRI